MSVGALRKCQALGERVCWGGGGRVWLGVVGGVCVCLCVCLCGCLCYDHHHIRSWWISNLRESLCYVHIRV